LPTIGVDGKRNDPRWLSAQSESESEVNIGLVSVVKEAGHYFDNDWLRIAGTATLQ